MKKTLFVLLMLCACCAWADFDRNNPVDLLALQTEVNTDPLGMGYDPNGGTQDLLNLLNNPSNNLGLETGVPPLNLGELWNIIASDSATATQFEFNIKNLFSMGNGPLTDVSDYRAAIVGLGDTQINAAIAARTRALSRGEVLFGGVLANGNYESVTITRDDWIAARDYQP